MIMVDQFRFDWMSCVGTDFVETPNIDRIAARGIRFTRAACNSPVCGPSRSSLAGGVYPHRLGTLENFVNYPLSQPTYYQALRSAGYRVAMIGKSDLHKGDHDYGEHGNLPVMYKLGFTDPYETEGKMNAAFRKNSLLGFDFQSDDDLAGPFQRYLQAHGLLHEFVEDYRRRFNPWRLWDAWPSPLAAEHFHDSFIGAKSCEYLESVSSESPWHLFVSFVGPHDPWDAPAEYVEAIPERSYPDSIEDDLHNKPRWIQEKADKHTSGMTPEDLDRVKRHYAAAIKLIDDWVGKILDTLQQRGLAEQTVVIFCADHGEMMGDHGLFQKSNMYEGALRIPFIIADPRQSTTGTSDALAELVDLHPTILELAGVDYTPSALDGKSLVSQLGPHSEPEAHKAYQFSELHNTRMLFDGRYKFIENHNDLDELYDLQADPSELNNKIQDMPDLAKRMRMKMRAIRK